MLKPMLVTNVSRRLKRRRQNTKRVRNPARLRVRSYSWNDAQKPDVSCSNFMHHDIMHVNITSSWFPITVSHAHTHITCTCRSWTCKNTILSFHRNVFISEAAVEHETAILHLPQHRIVVPFKVAHSWICMDTGSEFNANGETDCAAVTPVRYSDYFEYEAMLYKLEWTDKTTAGEVLSEFECPRSLKSPQTYLMTLLA